MSRLILYDLDGTVIDSSPGVTRCVAYAIEKMGFPAQPESVLRSFIGPPLNAQFMDVCGMTAEQAAEAVVRYREIYSGPGKFECTVYPGIPEAMRTLRDAGHEQMLASAKPELFSRQIIEHFSLDRYLSFLACATMDETRTDKAEIIAHAVRNSREKRSPGDVWMIGDRKYDMEGARANGVHAVGSGYGFGSREELEAAGAEVIVGSAAELAALLA